MMIKWREEHQTCESDEGVAIDRRIARPRQWVHAIVEPGKIFFSFWIFMNIFSSMQTQDGSLWTLLALCKHNIKRIWRPKSQFAKWKERNASMTHICIWFGDIFFLWNIFTLWKCVRRKGKVIAAYQELAVWCKIGGWAERGIGGGGERIGGGRHGKGGGGYRIGGGGWPPKVNELHCMACLPSFWQMDRMEPFVLPEHTNWTILEVHVLLGIQKIATYKNYFFQTRVLLVIVVLLCCVAVIGLT